jgi:hypothetical protein
MDKVKVNLTNFLIPYKCEDLLRIGNHSDGGYLVSLVDLINSNILISFGILYDWQFEKEVYKKYNIPVITYDGSVGKQYFRAKIKTRIKSMLSDVSLKNIKRTMFYLLLPIRFYNFFNNSDTGPIKRHNEQFVVNKKTTIDEETFRKKHGYVPNFITFEEIISQHIDGKNGVILKIDIEENEYDLLDSILTIENNLSMLLIEFHNLSYKNLNKVETFIKSFKLKLIHTHCVNFGWTQDSLRKIVNEFGNPLVAELTFSSSYIGESKVKALPHSLDIECNPEGDELEIVLPK